MSADQEPPSYLEQLLQQTLGLEGEARDAFLAGVAVQDPDTAAQIRAALDNPTLSTAPPEPDAESPPPEVPGYELLRELGRGGMGTVYLALQRETEREVALKLIRRTRADAAFAQRFRLEYRALARMSHPHIAQIFEAGVTPDGHPFFTMEHITGEPLTTYARTRHLDPRARIRLFQQVCAGVFHAHQQAVVHRDLKPSNILVDPHHGVKIIDFGIAGDLRAPEARTDLDGIMGTPAYMSPEMLRGEDLIHVHADIYALGVVLYELLVDAHPLDRTRFADLSWTDALTLLAEAPRPKPSVRLRGNGTKEPLRRLLRRDLDWVVMRAMAPDPAQRYPSPAALSRDLDRFLNHYPVHARGPDALYRAGRFLRRNILPVAASALILSSLVGAGAAKWRADQRLHAMVTNLQAYVRFMEHGLEAAAPRKLGVHVRLVDMLDDFERELDVLPTSSGRALVHRTLAKTYFGIDRYADAYHHLTQAYLLQEAYLGPTHPDTVDTLYEQSRPLRRLGETPAALAVLQDPRMDQLAEKDPLFRRRLNYGRGLLATAQKDYPGALTFLQAADMLSMSTHSTDAETWRIRVGLGIALHRQGQGVEALQLLEDASTHQAALLGEEAPEYLATRLHVARVLYTFKCPPYLDAAREHALAVNLIRPRKYGQGHSLSLQATHTLVRILYEQDAFEEALAFQVDLLAELPPDDPDVGFETNKLGDILARLHRPDEAAAAYEAVYREHAAAGRWSASPCLKAANNMADQLLVLGRTTEARALLVRLLAYQIHHHLKTRSSELTLRQAYAGDPEGLVEAQGRVDALAGEAPTAY